MDGRYHFLWLHITRQAYTLTRRLGIKGAVLGPLRSENLNVDNYSQRLFFFFFFIYIYIYLFYLFLFFFYLFTYFFVKKFTKNMFHIIDGLMVQT